MADTGVMGAIPAPSGITPNLVNPVNDKRGVILAAVSVMIVVPAVFVSLRMYVKLRLLREVKLADICCCIAWLLEIALCAIAYIMLEDGLGLHAWDVSLEGFSTFAEHNNIHQIIYVPAVCFIKVAILFQFSDIFVAGNKDKRFWLIHVLIALNFIFFTIIFFIIIFECNPRQKIWMPYLPGTCIDEQTIFVVSSIINVIDDFLILTLPMFWVARLHMASKKKLGIAAIFAAGLFACITSIVRLATSVQTFGKDDLTYVLLPVALWAIAEVASALIVFCLPLLPRLFRRTPDKPSKPSAHSGRQDYAHSTPRSRRKYEEMNDEDILLNGVPQMETTVKSLHPDDLEAYGKGPRDDELQVRAVSDDLTAGIHHTVSIKQTREAL